jgi:hypothetical protein
MGMRPLLPLFLSTVLLVEAVKDNKFDIEVERRTGLIYNFAYVRAGGVTMSIFNICGMRKCCLGRCYFTKYPSRIYRIEEGTMFGREEQIRLFRFANFVLWSNAGSGVIGHL